MSYPTIVELCGGRAVIVPCEARHGFKLAPDALAAAISPRTRWLLLNSPNNPSGAVYSRAELAALAEVLLANERVAVLSDDIYEHIRLDRSPLPTMARVEPRLFERALTANGVSKAYAMTGWRLGYAGGPTELIRAMTEVQAQSTSAPSAIAQAATIAALTGPQDEVRARSGIFMDRRKRLTAWLREILAFEIIPPDGAFYAFVGCRGLIGRTLPNGRTLHSDVDVASWLLEEHKVAVLPGAAFGQSPYLRLSFATSLDRLEEACRRMAQACRELA
jgi:aspartate aminotransferase